MVFRHEFGMFLDIPNLISGIIVGSVEVEGHRIMIYTAVKSDFN